MPSGQDHVCVVVGCIPSTVFTGDADLLRAFCHFGGVMIDVEGDVLSRKRFDCH
jgi:pyruvate/2-oxoglutarate dehydrogenase complex dihydrolipoamide dehydrogenase (E3) component